MSKALVKVLTHLASGGVVSHIQEGSVYKTFIEDGLLKRRVIEKNGSEYAYIKETCYSIFAETVYTLEGIRNNEDAQPVKLSQSPAEMKAIYAYTRKGCDAIQYSHLNQDSIFDAHHYQYLRNTDFDRLLN